MQSLGSYDGEYARSPYRRLATMPGNDVAQVHRYLDLGAKFEICHGPMDLLAADAVRDLRVITRGLFWMADEAGVVDRVRAVFRPPPHPHLLGSRFFAGFPRGGGSFGWLWG